MLFTAATMCSDQPVAPAAPHKIAWPRVPRSWSIVGTVATREDHGVSWHVVWWDTGPLISLGHYASCLVEDSWPLVRALGCSLSTAISLFLLFLPKALTEPDLSGPRTQRNREALLSEQKKPNSLSFLQPKSEYASLKTSSLIIVLE